VWLYNATSLEAGFAKAGLGVDLWAWGWEDLPRGPGDAEGVAKLSMEMVIEVYKYLGLNINVSEFTLCKFPPLKALDEVHGCCRLAPWIRVLMDGLDFSNREGPTLGQANRKSANRLIAGGCWEITDYNDQGFTYLTLGIDEVTRLEQYSSCVVSELGAIHRVSEPMWSGYAYFPGQMKTVNVIPKVSCSMGHLRLLVGGTPLPQPGGLSPFGKLMIPRSGGYVQETNTYSPIILGAISRFRP